MLFRSERKVFSIEQIDKLVVGRVLDRLKDEKFAFIVCPDHPTPCETKTHNSDPVPYLLYTNVKDLTNGATRYTEDEAAKTGEYVADGYKLIEKLFEIDG